ncbi:helix-turn-helix domain-containing protein [Catellatospora citrea]|uniref:Transcriptional regulator n=1 Tax=Catellatospora citrea TaxID=53366 RepID=A0A8J3K9Q9_9ACTN|nr:helix-turn-helix transcriptional regulator [Catellatospora citrea]RKE07401.1 helix-turn-helix protein [Catellatospora citrea]GIF95557.1 transcriptional regulator [Catellatospora citrea]
MVSGDLPAVARRRLRLALRGWREAAELTQGDVATALDWSLSKVQRIESGEVSLSGTDLRALLAKLEVSDPATVAELVQDARTARRRVAGWWDTSQYRSHLTPALMQLMQFESQATTIRSFCPAMVPGVLQTPRHAEAVLDFWSSELRMITEDQRAARLEVRLRRREHIFDRADRPTYLLTVDESVLLRTVGDRETGIEQLQHLMQHIAEGKIILRVVPPKLAGLAVTLGSFSVLELGSEDDAILYREAWARDEILHDPGEVSHHRRIFDAIERRSYSAERSSRLLEARIAALRAESDS